MKKTLLVLLLAITGLLYSCQKCELIDQIITNPPVDTMDSCPNVFFINKAENDDLGLTFFLNEFNKPIPNPFIYAEGTGPHPVPAFIWNIESNFSVYDSVNHAYIFEYFYDHGGPPNILFFHQNLNTGVFTFTDPVDTYSAPATLRNRVFAIRTSNVFEDITYEVIELNPVTGQFIGSIASGTFFANSPFTHRSMSSISDGTDKVYFLSGTNMVEVSISQSTSRHLLVDPTFNAMNNNISYHGIEFKDDTDDLIAMVTLIDPIAGNFTDLVVMEIASGSILITSIFNIAGELPSSQDDMINPDNYSTTFDQCENTYYVTEIQDEFFTNLTEIDLDSNLLRSQTIQGVWYGKELGLIK